MPEASVTSKGRITIPPEIREAMKLEPSDKVVFTLLPNGTTVIRPKNRTIGSLVGSLSRRQPLKNS